MTALPKPQESKRRVICWNRDEYLTVARRFFALLAADNMKQYEALALAQSVLPVGRHRPYAPSIVPGLRDVYEAWARDNDEAVKADRVAALNGFAEPMVEEFELPTRREPPPPATMAPAGPSLGLEAALAGMVGHAVGERIGQLTEAMREEMQRTRDEFQSLLAQQYDAMMCYWDPKYKERHEAAAEYVPDPALKLGVLQEVRVRQRKVLVVNGGKGDQFHNIRMHFKGVHFEFADSSNMKSLAAGTFYDLVVCTAFVGHKATGLLKNLHGNRVVYGDIRGMGALVAYVKKHLDL